MLIQGQRVIEATSYVQFLNLAFSDSSTVVYWLCTFLEDSKAP